MPALEANILSLHHVTATVADAQEDLDFYAGLLGLRLVKKTVNFDNHHVFHFYYGDEHGTPGTIWTTFPYKGYRVPQGRKGAGQINETALSVPAGTLAEWRGRLSEAGVAVAAEGARFGEQFVSVADPSGLNIELIETAADSRKPWTGSRVPAGMETHGVHSVTLTVREAPRSVTFLTDILGWRVIGHEGQRTRLAIGNGGPGKTIDVVHAPDAPAAMNGLGTVHHVAMAIGTAEEQLQAREALLRLGVGVTEVRDREYFLSIYFREPGGVLYEIATMKPGFAVDEPLAELGTSLKLPPWEEPFRAEIEAGLPEGKAACPMTGDPHAGQPVLTRGRPLGEGRAVMIMIHGRGAGPENILDLATPLAHPDFTYLAPAAADGTWYPFSFMMEIQRNEPGITSGLAAIDRLVREVVGKGIPKTRIMLLGFSQGACLTSTYAARNASRYGGVIVYSGGLIGPPGTEWNLPNSFAETPVFLGCSDVDAHVPASRVQESAEVFRRMGAEVTGRIYPGMGHLVNEDELEFARGLMTQVAAR